jgi:TonB family protein
MKVLILAVLLFPLWLSGQRQVQGKITADTRWFGEIRLKGDVTVPKGVTLTIDPGTRIIIDAKSDATKSGKDPRHVEITILGKIVANGSTNEGRIVFTSSASQPQMYDWYGIVIKNMSNNSLLKHCLIEYGYKGITCYGSSPDITGCEIRYNQYAGISNEVRSMPVIRSSTLSGNDFAGLVCELASNPVIEKNVITQNLNGIVIFDRSSPDLGRQSAVEGESVGENIILNNFESNIYNHSTNDVFAQNNIWNVAEEVSIQSTIFDNVKNPAKGKVLFMPVFSESATAQSRLVQQNIEENTNIPETKVKEVAEVAATTSLVTTETIPSTVRNSTTPVNRQSNKPSANETSQKPQPQNSQPQNPQPQVDSTRYLAANTAVGTALLQPVAKDTNPPEANTQPETLIVFKEIPVEKAIKKKEPEITEPVIEVLLDGGKRKYAHRKNPQYPKMYLKTGHQGRVLIEVTVDRRGLVEAYRPLRSDGDLFTDAAIEAVKKTRYKPGTYKGKPVKFKIVELYVFKLD